MNEDRAKQAFKEGRTVKMPTGATVDNLRDYHAEEKRFAEMKAAQKANPETDAIPATSPAASVATAPRTAFADTPPVHRVMRSRGFGAGGPDVGDDLPGDRTREPAVITRLRELHASGELEPSGPPELLGEAPLTTTVASTTEPNGDDNQPG